ncbi:MAG: ATP-grasp domain-containing protein [Spirulinaceae cyanobacterium]
MELLEYQAKTLFREVGIPVPLSQQIETPRALKQLQLAYPIVLKSQVRAGQREQAGGIRFVENTIDAIAAAQALFQLPIGGECPELLLAEARYNTEQELYLAVVLDYRQQLPVLLGSVLGGTAVSNAASATEMPLQTVAVEREFSPFYARHLAIQMGLKGDRIVTVSRILEKMYYLFARKDLDSVEIDPLAINAKGQVMALDGKVTLSPAALARHPELKLIVDIAPPQRPAARSWQRSQGQIGILCTNAGVGMMLWDALVADGCPVRACIVLATPVLATPRTESDVVNLAQPLRQILDQWQADGQYQHCLVALPPDEAAAAAWVGAIASYAVPEAIADYPNLKFTLYCPGSVPPQTASTAIVAASLTEVVTFLPSISPT